MTRPRKETRCQASTTERAEGKTAIEYQCQRAQGHPGQHTRGPIKWES